MEFRPVRRKDREISKEEALEVLKKGRYGVLSTMGEDGWPYGVPMSYTLRDGKIWFHGAKEGHKLDNIRFCDRVSFCVVGDTKTLPDKFSTIYSSAIVFGKIHECSDEEKMQGFGELVGKYAPAFAKEGAAYAKNASGRAAVFCLEIEHISGKARKK